MDAAGEFSADLAAAARSASVADTTASGGGGRAFPSENV